MAWRPGGTRQRQPVSRWWRSKNPSRQMEGLALGRRDAGRTQWRIPRGWHWRRQVDGDRRGACCDLVLVRQSPAEAQKRLGLGFRDPHHLTSRPSWLAGWWCALTGDGLPHARNSLQTLPSPFPEPPRWGSAPVSGGSAWQPEPFCSTRSARVELTTSRRHPWQGCLHPRVLHCAINALLAERRGCRGAWDSKRWM